MWRLPLPEEKQADKFWVGLMALVASIVSHHEHAYILAIPLAILAIVFLGSVMKKELGI